MIDLDTLALRLFEIGAVKIDTGKGFTLKLHETNPTAPLSPIYLNLRTPENPKQGPLTPELVREIGILLWRKSTYLEPSFDAIAGLPNAGTPLANAMKRAAYDGGLFVPAISLGKSETASGRRIEGIVDDEGASKGAIVLVIDDLITRGDSKNEGIEALRKAGYIVNDVLVLVDREQGGAEDLKKLGVKLHSVITLDSILTKLHHHNKISERQLEMILRYLGRK
ncbi:MAG TPA: phosphoribosyltransferase family protein [Candidatus Paceibacterota bacterium]|nr:phosphoribosyltransferase family protein [Candidatus Paceibacterota bacterium]